MSLTGTGWFRRQRHPAPAEPRAYPRIAAVPDEAAPATPECDLFAFNGPLPPRWREARITQVTATGSVGERDVLWLAVRAAWPPDHVLARALAAAWHERTGETAPPSNGIWHLSPGRGVQGYLNDYQVLIGNEQLMRDGGITLPDAARTQAAEAARHGHQTIFVGARSAPAERQDVHCSLIGTLIIVPTGSAEPIPATADVSAAPAAPVTPEPQPAIVAAASSESTAQPTAPARKTRHRLPWRLIAGLAVVSAALGVYKSAMTVQPEEVAIIRRFGRPIEVLGPGLHFRSYWPIEQVTRIRPFGVRMLHLDVATDATCERRARAGVEYRIGERAIDRVAYASAADDPDGLFARIAEATLREALAAPAMSALSLDWRRRMQDQLNALPLGLEIVSTPIFKIEENPNIPQTGTDAESKILLEANAAAKESLAKAQAKARQTIADARTAAERLRSDATADSTAALEAARREAAQLIARCGGPRATVTEARLKLISEIMDAPGPGRRSTVIDPRLGDRCRLYLLKGSGVQSSSVWTWPASQPAQPEEGRP